eukprot:200245_1
MILFHRQCSFLRNRRQNCLFYTAFIAFIVSRIVCTQPLFHFTITMNCGHLIIRIEPPSSIGFRPWITIQLPSLDAHQKIATPELRKIFIESHQNLQMRDILLLPQRTQY